MTQQEILEGNKLIAEFMRNEIIIINLPFEYEIEAELFHSHKIGKCEQDFIDEVGIEIDNNIVNSGNMLVDIPNYNNSWDWLMPVVSKFNTQEFDDWKDFGDLAAALVAVSIEDVFNIVLNGIKWYNKNKK